MNAKLLIGGLMLAASTTLLAQTQSQPGPPHGGAAGMRPCSQEPDPAKCEVRRKEMREHMKAARDTCKGKESSQRDACIAERMCAKAPDPAKCQARAKEKKQHRQEMREKGASKAPPKT